MNSNVGSDWYIRNASKTQSIESLETNKEFLELIGKDPARSAYFNELERAQAHKSKN